MHTFMIYCQKTSKQMSFLVVKYVQNKRKDVKFMANWKKVIAAGALLGTGAYVVAKFIVPKLSVICVHEDDDVFGDKDDAGVEKEAHAKEEKKEEASDSSDDCCECDCEHCGACGCEVTLREVPLEEVPDEVKMAIGALAAHVGFDVRQAEKEDEPQVATPEETTDVAKEDVAPTGGTETDTVSPSQEENVEETVEETVSNAEQSE